MRQHNNHIAQVLLPVSRHVMACCRDTPSPLRRADLDKVCGAGDGNRDSASGQSCGHLQVQGGICGGSVSHVHLLDRLIQADAQAAKEALPVQTCSMPTARFGLTRPWLPTRQPHRICFTRGQQDVMRCEASSRLCVCWSAACQQLIFSLICRPVQRIAFWLHPSHRNCDTWHQAGCQGLSSASAQNVQTNAVRQHQILRQGTWL